MINPVHTARKRAFSALMALAMLLTLLPAVAPIEARAASAASPASWNGSIDTGWYNSSGTSFTISAPAQLAGLAAIVNGTAEEIAQDSFWGKTITLTANLDLDGEPWIPIGLDSINTFQGSFDGGGHVITGLAIGTENSPANYENAGLFGDVNGGAIQNLGVDVSIHVSGDLMVYVGGLVGMSGSTITNCYATGTVSGEGYFIYTGGLVGQNMGVLTGCYATGTVSGTTTGIGGSASTGGLVGMSSYTITGCYAMGTVSGTATGMSGSASTGGLVGHSSDTITGCYATGAVSGTATDEYSSASTGGLVGYNSSTATSCYATGTVSGTATGESGSASTGGLVGYNSSTATGCYATGAVSGAATGESGSAYTGGLVGYNADSIRNGYFSHDATGQMDGIGNHNDNQGVDGMALSDMQSQAFADKLNEISGGGGYYWVLMGAGEAPTISACHDGTGSGAPADPYRIRTEAQLRALALHVNTGNDCENECYRLETNIALTGGDWMPIGLSGSAFFLGSFDGGGHEVTGLAIGTEQAPASYEYAGLFGYVGSGGAIQNLGVDVSIYISSSSDIHAGGLAGRNDGAITGCCVTGAVSGTATGLGGSAYTGGLAGWNYGGTITGCYATSTVSGAATGTSGSTSTGGLVGRSSGTITGCYATGTVSGTATDESHYVYIGGLVGSNGGAITGCYATGAVSGKGIIAYTGGLVGSNINNGTITGCYATGTVSGTATGIGGSASTGGLVGYNYAGATITDSYFSSDATGQMDGIGYDNNGQSVDDMALSDMQTQAFADTLNETTQNSGCYWFLLGAGKTPTVSMLHDGAGGGTDGDPYRIRTEGQLRALAVRVNAGNDCANEFYRLEKNIALTGGDWVPIGLNELASFRGSFYGGGHTITGLAIGTEQAPASYEYAGLFGYVGSGGAIQNLGVDVSIHVSGSSDIYAGGLAGYSSGTITGCYATGAISGTAAGMGFAYTGGLVGSNDGGTITGCYATGAVSGTTAGMGFADTGGLVGRSSGSITGCYAMGTVSGTVTGESFAYTGGLVGMSSGTITSCYATGAISGAAPSGNALTGGLVGDSSSTITDCYATGTVSGTAEGWNGFACTGGLVGYNSDTITSCYATGAVTGTATGEFGFASTGGLVGGNNSNSTITGCYFNTETTGQDADVGGATGLTTAEMTNAGVLTGDMADLGDTDWYQKSYDDVYVYYPIPAGLKDNNMALEATRVVRRSVMAANLSATSITYGEALADSTISGDMTWSDDSRVTVAGEWAWEDGSILPTVVNEGYAATFTPKYPLYKPYEGLVSLTVVPVPGAPQNLTAAAGSREVTLSWEPPLEDGGSEILSYELSIDGGAYEDIGKVLRYTATGLSNGTGYTFRIRAVNAESAGIAASIAATPGESRGGSSSGGGSSTYTVTFDANGGSSVPSQRIGHNGMVTKPADPTREGCTFTGWYTDAELSAKYDFTTKVTKAFTLYAGWEEAGYHSAYEHPAYISGYSDGTFRPDNTLTRAEAAQLIYNLIHSSAAATAYVPGFSDVAGDAWYHGAVMELAGRGIISGHADGSFRPDAAITRAEFVAMALRFAGLDGLEGAAGFSDVAETHWAAAYIAGAAVADYVSGYPDGTFRPENSVSRAEAVTILNRVTGRNGLTGGNTFSDAPAGHWAYEDITSAATEHS